MMTLPHLHPPHQSNVIPKSTLVHYMQEYTMQITCKNYQTVMNLVGASSLNK